MHDVVAIYEIAGDVTPADFPIRSRARAGRLELAPADEVARALDVDEGGQRRRAFAAGPAPPSLSASEHERERLAVQRRRLVLPAGKARDHPHYGGGRSSTARNARR